MNDVIDKPDTVEQCRILTTAVIAREKQTQQRRVVGDFDDSDRLQDQLKIHKGNGS